jgi:hypothetical protein
MKKSKLLAVCLIGVLMAVGLVVMGCGSKCDEDYWCRADAIDDENGRAVYGFRPYSNPEVTCDKNCSDSSCAPNKVMGKPYDGYNVNCDCNER